MYWMAFGNDVLEIIIRNKSIQKCCKKVWNIQQQCSLSFAAQQSAIIVCSVKDPIWCFIWYFARQKRIFSLLLYECCFGNVLWFKLVNSSWTIISSTTTTRKKKATTSPNLRRFNSEQKKKTHQQFLTIEKGLNQAHTRARAHTTKKREYLWAFCVQNLLL